MFNYLAIGTILGLSAGLAPGPLLTLVISETLTHNIRAGIKIATAPLFTDLPIIIITVFILSRLSGFHSILGIVSIIGGIVILMMGIQSLRFSGTQIHTAKVQVKSLAKGIIANIFSPHPYLFWLSVGAPTFSRAYNENIIYAISFILSFYIFIIGSKIFLAILVGKSKKILSGPIYIFTLKGLGLLLIILSLKLIKDGLEFFNFF